MRLSLLSEGIKSSCLAHYFSGIKAIYCYYRNHVTMTTEVYRGLIETEVSVWMSVSGKEAIYYNKHC